MTNWLTTKIPIVSEAHSQKAVSSLFCVDLGYTIETQHCPHLSEDIKVTYGLYVICDMRYYVICITLYMVYHMYYVQYIGTVYCTHTCQTAVI